MKGVPRPASKVSKPLPDRRALTGLIKSRGTLTDYSKVTPVDLKTPRPTSSRRKG